MTAKNEQNALAVRGNYDLSAEAVNEAYQEQIQDMSNEIFDLYKGSKPDKKKALIEAAGLGFLVQEQEGKGKYALPEDEVVKAAICNDWAGSLVEEKTVPGIVTRLKSAIAEVEARGPEAVFYELGETRKQLALPYDGEAAEASVEDTLAMVTAGMDRDANALTEVAGKVTDIRDKCREAKKTVVSIDIGEMERGRDGKSYVTEDGTPAYTVTDVLADLGANFEGSGDLLDKVEARTSEQHEQEGAVEEYKPNQQFEIALRDLRELAEGGQGAAFTTVAKGAVVGKGNAVKQVAQYALDRLEQEAKENGVELNDDTMLQVTGIDRYRAQKKAEAGQAAKGKGLLIK